MIRKWLFRLAWGAAQCGYGRNIAPVLAQCGFCCNCENQKYYCSGDLVELARRSWIWVKAFQLREIRTVAKKSFIPPEVHQWNFCTQVVLESLLRCLKFGKENSGAHMELPLNERMVEQWKGVSLSVTPPSYLGQSITKGRVMAALEVFEVQPFPN